MVNSVAETSAIDSVDVRRSDISLARWWLITFIFVGGVYCATMVPGVAFGDSGDAQLRVELGWWTDTKDLSRSHPLFYFLAIGMKNLGVEAAQAATYVSAVAGGLTVANLVVLFALMGVSRTAVASSAIVLATSHALWHISTVAEVMSLSTTFFTLELIFVFQWFVTEKPRWLIAAALMNGLGLSTHNLAMLSWPAYGVVFWQMRKQTHMLNVRILAACLFAGLITALPLIAIFVRSVQDGLGIFATIHEMASGRYSSQVFRLFPEPVRLLRMVAYTGYSFPTPLIFLVPAGVMAARRVLNKPFFLFVGLAVAVHFVFAIRYDVPDQHVFLLHSYLLGTLFLVFGVDKWIRQKPEGRRATLALVLSCLAPVVFMVVPGVLRTYLPDVPVIPRRELKYREPYDSFLKPWRQGQDGAGRFAREVLEAVPKDAILFLDTTVMTPILYVQEADNFRRDVRICYCIPYQPFFEERPELTEENLQRWIAERRLCSITDNERYLSFLISGDRFVYIREGPIYYITFASETAAGQFGESADE